MPAEMIEAEVAGPEECLRLKRAHLMPCTYHFHQRPPQIVRGEGAMLFDHLGRAYIDCLAGVGVMNAGHCNPAIVEAAVEQARTLQHTTTIHVTEPVLRLAEALSTIVPVPDPRFFFCVSGSEAVEFALMTATQITNRRLVIATDDGLHGRTRWAMNVTGVPMWRSDPFPMDDRVLHVPFNDVTALRAALERHRGDVAAFIAEPVQGNGGINVPSDAYWPAVRALCEEFGVVLIADEVQTGFNRTGRWFACEHWGVEPDIVCISKGLGNGFPIAAVGVRGEMACKCTRPAASTHGGNPVSAAAALANIAEHRELRLGECAISRGEQLLSGLRQIAIAHPGVCGPPRGKGLMLGIPIRSAGGASSASRCDALLETLKNLGVLAGKAGAERDVLTFLPPLVVSDRQISQVLEALEHAAWTVLHSEDR